MGGFSGASIWKWEGEGRFYALRRWPPETLPRPRILGLHRLLNWWNREGVKEFPLPLPVDSGATLWRMDEYDWQLEPWMPGVADFQSNPSDERLREVVSWLARLHLISSRYEPDEASREWFQRLSRGTSPNVSERISLVGNWTRQKLQQTESQIRSVTDASLREPLISILTIAPLRIPQVETELRVASQIDVPLFPCLRDLWHDHLLFSGDRLTGVIDPSACRTESASSDLSRLLGSLLPFDKPRWDVALNHYSTIRPLSVSEWQLVEILDRSQILLSGLYWANRLTHSSEQYSSEILSKRLETIVARLERL